MSLFKECLICAETKSDALLFTADGNYGSSIFDPMSGWTGGDKEYLEVTICDDCIIKAVGRVRHVKQSKPRPTTEVTDWRPLPPPTAPPEILPDGLWKCVRAECEGAQVLPSVWIEHVWTHFDHPSPAS